MSKVVVGPTTFDLHVAICANDVRGVRMLLEQGVNLNKRVKKRTALACAVHTSNNTILRMLLESVNLPYYSSCSCEKCARIQQQQQQLSFSSTAASVLVSCKHSAACSAADKTSCSANQLQSTSCAANPVSNGLSTLKSEETKRIRRRSDSNISGFWQQRTSENLYSKVHTNPLLNCEDWSPAISGMLSGDATDINFSNLFLDCPLLQQLPVSYEFDMEMLTRSARDSRAIPNHTLMIKNTELELPIQPSAKGPAPCRRIDLNQISAGEHSRFESALFMACRLGNRVAVRLLIDHGADLETLNHEERSVLWMATANRDALLVELLMERGASVNPSQHWYNNPLYEAFRKSTRNSDVIRSLALNGVNFDLQLSKQSFRGQFRPPGLVAMMRRDAATQNYDVTALRILRLMYDCGYPFTALEITDLFQSTPVQESAMLEYPELCGKEWAVFPRTLQHLSILYVRSAVIKSCAGKLVRERLRELPLPQEIISKLLLKQVEDYWPKSEQRIN